MHTLLLDKWRVINTSDAVSNNFQERNSSIVLKKIFKS